MESLVLLQNLVAIFYNQKERFQIFQFLWNSSTTKKTKEEFVKIFIDRFNQSSLCIEIKKVMDKMLSSIRPDTRENVTYFLERPRRCAWTKKILHDT